MVVWDEHQGDSLFFFLKMPFWEGVFGHGQGFAKLLMNQLTAPNTLYGWSFEGSKGDKAFSLFFWQVDMK